jgi:hypothetical protein
MTGRLLHYLAATLLRLHILYTIPVHCSHHLQEWIR